MIARGLDINGFIVIEVMAGGQHGTLYLARHPQTRQEAIVRIAHPTDTEPGIIQVFVNEATSLLPTATQIGQVRAANGQDFLIAAEPAPKREGGTPNTPAAPQPSLSSSSLAHDTTTPNEPLSRLSQPPASVPSQPTERLKPISERAQEAKAELARERADAESLTVSKSRGPFVVIAILVVAILAGLVVLVRGPASGAASQESARAEPPTTPAAAPASTPARPDAATVVAAAAVPSPSPPSAPSPSAPSPSPAGPSTCPSDAWKQEMASKLYEVGARAESDGVPKARLDALTRTVGENIARASSAPQCAEAIRAFERLPAELARWAPKAPTRPKEPATPPAKTASKPTPAAAPTSSTPEPAPVKDPEPPSAPAAARIVPRCTPDDAWKRRMNLNLTDIETNANAMTPVEVSRATLELYRELKTVTTPEQCGAFEERIERLIRKAIK